MSAGPRPPPSDVPAPATSSGPSASLTRDDALDGTGLQEVGKTGIDQQFDATLEKSPADVREAIGRQAGDTVTVRLLERLD